MATEYLMPKLAMAMSEGTISQWLIEDGEYVEKNQEFLTLETEKVAYDVESPVSGFFKIGVPNGETVPVDTCVGYFVETEEELAELTDKLQGQAVNTDEASMPSQSPETNVEDSPASSQTKNTNNTEATQTALSESFAGRIKASPLAKKIARDNQLDIATIPGTGPGGRIVKRDVLKAMEEGIPLSAGGTAAGQLVEKARIPFKGLRSTIAERMVYSQQNTASLASNWESDITRLLEVRSNFVSRTEQLGTKISVNALLIKAICYAVRQVPISNAAQVGEEIVIYDSINIGIALALPGASEYESGLMVPVLKGVHHMGVVDIDKNMKALIGRARDGSISNDDLSDSTITLSSTAGISPPGLTTAPILNSPNAVIVGPSTPKDKAVVIDGEIKIRTMMPLSMTFDHRLMDGEPAARFMKALHDCLETPELMLA